MAARLGWVLYWAATLFAGFLMFMVVLGSVRCGDYGPAYCQRTSFFRYMVGGFAVVVWLVGLACKYVLGGGGAGK